jgi:hypothetical protein
MTFAGSIQSIYPIMQQTPVDIGDTTQYLQPNGMRVYLNTGSTQPGPIPTEWPVLSDPNARACISIRPEPYSVAQGDLDSELKAWLSQAPSGPPWLLGLWHEASTMNYPIQPGNLRTAQSHIQALCQKYGYNVLVGAIENATISASNASTWMARNLDFYTCDIYDDRTCDTVPSTQLDSFQSNCNALMDSGTANIGVTETNSRCPGRRPYWFWAVWSWLQTNGFSGDTSCFLTYWNDSGEESGPWLTDDWATFDTLYAIFEQAAP